MEHKAKVFKGKEVEHTQYYNADTIFLADIISIQEAIGLSTAHSSTHFYLGACHAIESIDIRDLEHNANKYMVTFKDMKDKKTTPRFAENWGPLCKDLLEQGYKVTLEVPARCYHSDLFQHFPDHENLIIQIRIGGAGDRNLSIKLAPWKVGEGNGVYVQTDVKFMLNSDLTTWQEYEHDVTI